MIPPRSALIAGPRRYFVRCVNGVHVRGGQCGHAGGIMDGNSCYILEPRRQLCARPLIGGGFTFWVEEIR